MIKEALQYVSDLKAKSMEPIVKEINGKTYCNMDLRRYDTEPMAEAIRSTTLTAMVDYMKNRSDELKESMIVHVVSPVKVELYSGLTKERKREYLFECNAIVPKFEFDRWYDQERFLIETQADFEVTSDMEVILKVSGNVEAKTTATCSDDGISQKTTIKQGIASKADVLVPNPVTLTPYRTFLEVPQPESQFVFRIKDVNSEPAFKLVEAEGGLWKNKAMENIKDYFNDQLRGSKVISRVTIIS